MYQKMSMLIMISMKDSISEPGFRGLRILHSPLKYTKRKGDLTMENVDFVTTVNDQQIVIEKVTKADEQKEAEKLKSYADAIAKANNGNS